MTFLETITSFASKLPLKGIKKFLFEEKEADTVLSVLSEQPIFSGLSLSQLKVLKKYTRIESINTQDEIASLNLKIDNSICCILSGKIKVKDFSKQGEDLEYQAGEMVNPLALIEQTPGYELTEVLEPTTLLILHLQELKNKLTYRNGIESMLLRNTARYSLESLVHTKEILKNTSKIGTYSIEGQLAEVKTRMLFGIFVIRILIVLCLYTISIKILTILGLKMVNSSPITILILSITAGIMYQIMLQTKLPMSNFGVTFINWKVAIQESLLFSFIFTGLATLIKFLLIHYHSAYQGIALFDLNIGIKGSKIKDAEGLLFFFLYIIFAPIQEFLVRGGLQGALNSFLYGSGNARLWTSIFISNLLFMTFHLHVSIGFALMAFFPGIFWGWLYARHKTLVGVSISHIMIGVYTIFILGLSRISAGLI